jgi:hypothetical protein
MEINTQMSNIPDISVLLDNQDKRIYKIENVLDDIKRLNHSCINQKEIEKMIEILDKVHAAVFVDNGSPSVKGSLRSLESAVINLEKSTKEKFDSLILSNKDRLEDIDDWQAKHLLFHEELSKTNKKWTYGLVMSIVGVLIASVFQFIIAGGLKIPNQEQTSKIYHSYTPETSEQSLGGINGK